MPYHKVDDNGKEVLGAVDSLDVNLDTTNFNKNLDNTVTDVQKLADKVDDLNISSLPSGTVNQTLRHNGTEWVANSTLVINRSAYVPTIFEVGCKIGGEYDSYGKCRINSPAEGYVLFDPHQGAIYIKGGLNDITMEDNNERIIFNVNYAGAIKSRPLSGTGTRNLVALSDGTIAVDSNTTTKTKIINHTVTAGGSIFSFDNAALGISGDLTTKILSFEILRKTGANTYFSAGEFMLNEKTLSSTAVTFQSNGTIPTNDVLRISIVYSE